MSKCGILNKPGDSFSFDPSILISEYQDVDGDSPGGIVILEKPQFGAVYIENVPMKPPVQISLEKIPLVQYVRVSPNSYTDEVKYKVYDKRNNKKLSNMATMTINVQAYSNQPPSIGDNELSIEFGATKVYTVEDFTTNTTPPYSDPENDGPFKLKITSLPATGELRFNNVPVAPNDEVLFLDIAKGLLVYLPDNTELDGYSGDTFDFEISDLGSQQFSS